MQDGTASDARAGLPLETAAGVRPAAVNGSGTPFAFGLENPDYLTRQLVTYIGNKRGLLGPIGRAIETVKKRLNKTRLRAFDAFSGSGVVSRYLKAHASYLASNDIEDYATVISRCYLRNRSTVDMAALEQTVDGLNARVERERLPTGFIREPEEMRSTLNRLGTVHTFETLQHLSRKQKLARQIALHVTEHLFLVESA